MATIATKSPIFALANKQSSYNDQQTKYPGESNAKSLHSGSTGSSTQTRRARPNPSKTFRSVPPVINISDILYHRDRPLPRNGFPSQGLQTSPQRQRPPRQYQTRR